MASPGPRIAVRQAVEAIAQAACGSDLSYDDFQPSSPPGWGDLQVVTRLADGPPREPRTGGGNRGRDGCL